MRPTILHVEDDTALAEIVEISFEGFGFRGTTLHAETVTAAQSILDDRARRGDALDLIISDMSLPDGSGLDVVRDARRNPAWEHTPILILSGDADPRKVGRAYALGANCYVAKSPVGRSLGAVVKTLYDHWLRDVELPAPLPEPLLDRTSGLLAKAVNIRGRHAAFYLQMADLFGDSPSEAAFWLTRALSESNLANLIMFLLGQLEQHPLPAEHLDELERAQAEGERTLETIEREIKARPIATRDEAYQRMLQLISIFDVQPYVRSLSHAFPVAPVATAALIDFLAGTLDDQAGWLEIHTTDPAVRGQVAQLRGQAASLRALHPDSTAVHESAQ